MIANNYLNYCEKIKKESEPLLTYLPIRKISYLEVQPDGKFITFCSDAVVFEELIKAGFLKNYSTDTLSLYHTPGYYLNDYYNFNENLDLLRARYKKFFANFEYGHAFFIVENEALSNANIYRIYIYESMLGKPNINHEYLNNIDLLKRFNKHIQSVICQFRSNLDYSKVDTQGWNDFKCTLDDSISVYNHDQLKKQIYLSKLNLIPYRLSPREKEIAYWYVKGKTSLETGSLLGISNRTVENIFEAIKIKTGCKSKREFLAKFSECK